MRLPPLLAVSSVLLLSIVTVYGEESKSLYAPGDNVLELDIDNFDSMVYGSPRGYFIEFYSSWCGHCIHYKPQWVTFATKLKDWSSVVQVSVINCADEKNSPVCRAHAIDAFPTLKYFPPHSKSKDDGQKYTGDKYELPSMALDVAKFVRADYVAQRPPTWPKVEALPSTIILEQLWSAMSPSQQILVAVIEEDPFLTGFATVIGFGKNPFVEAVVMPSSHPIAQQFSGSVLPTLLIFKRDNPNAPDFVSKSEMSVFQMADKIDEYITAVADTVHQGPPPPAAVIPGAAAEDVVAAPAPTKTLVPLNFEQFKVQQLDLSSALHYMLTQEIPRKPVIDNENLAALKGWIHLLRRYVPGTAPIRRLFYRLDEWTQLQSYSITAESWIAKVAELQTDLGHPLPANASWVACKGSKPYLRGYTCGLWTLMHAVTVQAYADEKDNHGFKPVVEVLEPIHQFIYHYLSCEICAKNFHHMTEANELSLVTRPEDVILWLWRAHNNVNRRLAGDASEDPSYPKRQFPDAALCHDCIVNGVYQEGKVLEFMLRYYTDVRTDGLVPTPGYKVTEFEDGKVQKVAVKHLNPKFAIHANNVDKLEETEARLRQQQVDANPKHHWRSLDSDGYAGAASAQSADRSTFYLIWFVIVGIALAFAYLKYRQNRSKFWKTFYYYNDYKLYCCCWYP
uniref:Sulfhydryl oxidase n=1 Tax=Panagrellus redivivus TaxID=6233 RepID=A0A7E4VNB3_PANRE